MKTLKEVEKDHILYAMKVLGHNKPKVAEALGISLKSLYNKLNSYGAVNIPLPSVKANHLQENSAYE